VPTEALPSNADAWMELARSYHAREDLTRANATVQGAMGLLFPGDARRDEWSLEASLWREDLDE
jgi:hypothetical protein